MRRTRCAFRLASAMLLDCTWSFLHHHFQDRFSFPPPIFCGYTGSLDFDWWPDHREVVAFRRILRCYFDLDRSLRRLAASKFG